MPEGPLIAPVGALIGDPARANILTVLLDGKARTATELSHIAGVSPQTTSAHLSKLVQGKLICLEKQGRNRYFRLTSHTVAEAIEALVRVAGDAQHPTRSTRPRDQVLRRARTCYDHIAGQLGVALMDSLFGHGHLVELNSGLALSDQGERYLKDLGVDIDGIRQRRRPFARTCLDWSERRPHLAGALGAALADRCFSLRWIEHLPDSRALKVTARGRAGFSKVLGVDPPW